MQNVERAEQIADEVADYLFSLPDWEKLSVLELYRRAVAYRRYLEMESQGKILCS